MLHLTLSHLALPLGAGVLLLPVSVGPARACAGAGLVAFALGATAFQVVAGSASLGALGAAAPSFAAVNLGLLLAGLGTGIAAAIPALRDGSVRGRVGAGLVLAATIATLFAVYPAIMSVGLVRTLGATVLVGLAGAGIVALVVRLAGARAAPSIEFTPLHPVAAAGILVGGGAVLLASHLGVMVAGAVVAAVAPLGFVRVPAGRSGVLLLAVVLLLPAVWLIATIAGPVGLRLDALARGPFSPAAEVLLVLPVAVAAWVYFGLFPVHRGVPGALVGWVGAALLVRLGHGVFPGGMEHWQPLLIPLGVAGVWHGAVTRRPGETWLAVAWIGAVTGTEAGVAGVTWLLAALAGMALLPPRMRFAEPARFVLSLAAIWGGVLVLEAAVRVQVVYSVAAATGVAVAAIVAGRSIGSVDPSPGPAHIRPVQAV